MPPCDVSTRVRPSKPAPESRSDADTLRSYFKQLREETGRRVLQRAYTESGELNKWWMAFSKKKFMNKAL